MLGALERSRAGVRPRQRPPDGQRPAAGAGDRGTPPGFGSYAVSKAPAEAIARQFAAGLAVPVGVVDPGQVATGLADGTGRAPDEVAPLFRWAAVDAPADSLDGSILGLRDWKTATR